MIQRIQSLFLLLAAATCVLVFFFPISGNLSQQGVSEFYELYAYVLKVYKPGVMPQFDYWITLPLAIGAAAVFILSLITLFLYKDRMRQMVMVKICAFINILLIVGIFIIYTRIVESRTSIEGDYGIGAFFPLICLVFLILAFRRIRRDEKLVRSADRLR